MLFTFLQLRLRDGGSERSTVGLQRRRLSCYQHALRHVAHLQLRVNTRRDVHLDFHIILNELLESLRLYFHAVHPGDEIRKGIRSRTAALDRTSLVRTQISQLYGCSRHGGSARVRDAPDNTAESDLSSCICAQNSGGKKGQEC